MVPEAGLEPALCYQNWILNPARLPISPLRQELRAANYIFFTSLTIPTFQLFVRSAGVQTQDFLESPSSTHTRLK
jgi:hypothetical protein